MSKRSFADLSPYRLAPTERAWLERIRSKPQPVKKEPAKPGEQMLLSAELPKGTRRTWRQRLVSELPTRPRCEAGDPRNLREVLK